MNGYAAVARIDRARPRVVVRGSSRDEAEVASGTAIVTSQDGAVAVTPASPTADEILGERWASFCDRWSQLTFFLFDANGWR